MASLPTIPEPPLPTGTIAGDQVIVTFVGNTKYVVGGGKLKGIQVRRVADGQRMASLEVEGVTCLAGSKDGGWIAAGTTKGVVVLWDTETYERVFEHEEPYAVEVVDFFRSSTRLESASNRIATIWDVPSGERLQTLDLGAEQTAVGYLGSEASDADILAVAPENSVRIYDTSDARLLTEIPVRVTSPYFYWFGDYLFLVSDNTVKQVEVSTGVTVAEWPVPNSKYSCIAVCLYGEFIAYSAEHTVTFWNTSTHTKFGLIERPLEISYVAFSPNDLFLAICGLDGEVIIQDMEDGLPSCYSAPRIHITETTLDSNVLLTDTITAPHRSNHAPTNRSLVRVLTKRSKAYLADGLWELALIDANKVIELDPSSPWGYERKHAALHKAGEYENAFNAFEMMLSKMSQSSDPELRCHYINPTNTRATIQHAVQDAIRGSPPMLINTTSGRLLDKLEQAASFESLPVFRKLMSSMTTIIDHICIERCVKQYYRYAMFSHTWENNEPLFDKVIRVMVYDLEDLPANGKLKRFCKTVQDDGLHWAWSDTCCIDREDNFALQEALVAMFNWYQGSAMTLILLRGVRSPSEHGGLIRSMWNTRMWTLYEYHASNVVRFYTEDWQPYRDIDIPNHKESPIILSEMEEAIGISTQALRSLQPGPDNVREKLYLVSRRETTLVEDEAYSLFGIFSMSVPVVYGDGDKALGRLLAQILSNSGDASILAWTGRSGSFNSCLPGRICAFSQLLTSYIPLPIVDTDMEAITATSSLDFDLAINLHDRLQELPAPLFVGQQLKLPCLNFQLELLPVPPTGSGQVYRAQTPALGIVEIESTEDLSKMGSLTLIHPWIGFLGKQFAKETVTSEVEVDNEPPPNEPPALTPHVDRRTAALRVIARLRQPFGALLLTPTCGDVTKYRRVASESLITVQVQEDTPLNDLINGLRILDVL